MKGLYCFIFLVTIFFGIQCNLDRIDDQGPFQCGQIFTDPRDGKMYKTIWIAEDGSHDLSKPGKCWMAQNLDFNSGNITSNCYLDQAVNCDTFGRLYVMTVLDNLCMNGWHIASSDDWDDLYTTYAWTGNWTGFATEYSGNASFFLPGGTSGINLLMGGSCSEVNGCSGKGQSITYWTNQSYFISSFLKSGNAIVGDGGTFQPPSAFRYYVRCVKDD